MTRFMLFSVALMVVLAQAAMATTISIDVTNSSFETGPIGTFPASIVGWTTTKSWPEVESSGFNGQNAADGTHYLRIANNSAVSQSLGSFHTGTATVNFYAGGRDPDDPAIGSNQGGGPMQVTLDGTALEFSGIDTITPTDHPTMVLYTSDPFAVTAGSHTLAFAGVTAYSSGNDYTEGIDLVTVSNTYTVPEPSALILGVTGVIGLLAYAWRKRK